VYDLVHQTPDVVTLKRHRAGQHLEGHHRKGKLVRVAIHRFAGDVFGRHVGRGAHDSGRFVLGVLDSSRCQSP